jgi:hypothetical protein
MVNVLKRESMLERDDGTQKHRGTGYAGPLVLPL